MKKIIVLAVAMLLGMSGAALAAGTSTVAVSATVLGSCTISGGTAAFGNLDPAGAGPVSAAISQPQVNCTNGAPYTITDDKGMNGGGTAYKMANGTDLITYALSYTTAGLGTGAGVNIGLAASVAALDYQNKPAGSYTDTITLSVLP